MQERTDRTGTRKAALLVGFLLALGAGRSEAKTIRVPGDAANITAAVAAAAGGDTILVAPGTYSRAATKEVFPIFVSKEVIILGQEDPTKCVLVPDATTRAVQEREIECFIVRDIPDGERFVLRGFTFEKPKETANPGTKSAAMDIYRAAALIENCRFMGLDTGVRVGGEGKVKVAGCHAEDVMMPFNAIKGEVVLEKNESIRARVGLDLEWARGVVRGNRCLGALRDGIAVSSSDSLLVEGNYVEGSARCGISLRESSPAVLRNEFVRNKYSIWCIEKSAPRIARNIVRESQGYDLGCERGSAPIVGGSLAEANDFFGDGTYFVNNLTDQTIDCRLNFWGSDCPANQRFTGQVRFSPWTDRAHTAERTRCEAEGKR